MATRLVKRPSNSADLTTFSSSVGASPVTAYTIAPFESRVMWASAVLRGALSTADATITITNVTTGNVIGTLTLTQAGSAAGSSFGVQPSGTPNVQADDVISLTPSGASGASVGCDYRLTFETHRIR